MMKKKWHSLLAALLALCMVLCAVPMTAFPAEVRASEESAEEAAIEEAFLLYEEADGAEEEAAAGALLDTLQESLGDSASGIFEKLKELLGGSADILELIKKLLGNPADLLEKLQEFIKDPAAAIAKLRDFIDMMMGKEIISYIYLTSTVPEPGQPCQASSVLAVGEGEKYTLEKAVFVVDGAESEESMTFSPYELFQIRVTLKAYSDTRFLSTLFASSVENSENVTIEKVESGALGGDSEVIALVTMRAAKKKGVIETVRLTVEGPLGGQRSDEFIPIVQSPLEDSYAISSTDWCDASGNLLEDPVTFEAGKTYYMSVNLNADEGSRFEEETTSVSVEGGTSGGKLSVDNQEYEDTVYSTAIAVVAVVAGEAPEGMIQKIELSFTLPEVGTKYTQEGKKLTPPFEISVPEDAPYTFDGTEKTWIVNSYTTEPVSESGEIQYDLILSCYTILKTDAPGSFYKYPLVSIENADFRRADLLSDTTLGILYEFSCSAPEAPDCLHILVSDKEQNSGAGGTVKVEFTTPDGKTDESETQIVDEARAIGTIYEEGSKVTLTALPEEGYTFAGWYKGNEGVFTDVDADFNYYEDSLISSETSMTYAPKSDETLVCCAVFDSGKSSHAKKVSLNKTTAKMLVGKTLQLKAALSPSGAADTVSWKSGNTDIATVNSKGLVTAKSAGKVKIRAVTSNGLKAYCTITVTFRYVYQCEKNGVYRWTTSKKIINQLKEEGWTSKKAFRAPGLSGTKVYWVYDKTTKRFRYTTNLTYAKKQKAAGNKAGFAFYSASAKTVPVYELSKGTKRVTYYYTMKKSEAKEMMANGWTYRHIAWYAQPTA